jgi:hypothetical protein
LKFQKDLFKNSAKSSNMAKKVRTILFVSLFIFAFQAKAQDIAFIVLLKGTASVKFTGSDQLVNLLEATRLPLPRITYILLPANSSALVYNEKSKLEIGSPVEETYKTISLIESLNKKKTNSITSNFYRYMNRMYVQMKEREESQGTVVGAVSRSLKDSPPGFSPTDSVIVLSDTLEFKWGKRTSLRSNLILVNETSRDTVYNSYPKGDSLLLGSLSSGFYSWSYDLVDIEKSLLYKYRNVFIIPSASQKQKLLTGYENFINSVRDLGRELQLRLINDFLTINKYYFLSGSN